jgi:hypothetical protein
MIPEPYQFVLLILVAYRTWRLIAEDDILERPRRWLVRLPRDWKEGDDPARPKALPKGYRENVALFLNCPWCAGAWISLLVYIGWIAALGEWPDTAGDVFVGLGVWFALSCTVGLVRRNLDPPDE